MAEHDVSKLIRDAKREALDILSGTSDYIKGQLPQRHGTEPLNTADLRKRYASMTAEDIAAEAIKAGHRDDEAVPCELCGLIADMETRRGKKR